ncbi:flagellar export protein FliJ [Paraburkholderia bonniea]|uniref:flagellar export protein FliJ n=1 Tax=Paraburkholderia bonniea TaxID=2152891 RepID=UPI00129159A7|nr:flagellar export protein FliJ [Paraburkholderia bonniea]WJF90776.1 flagellar export protein FliJ [Paraburkholderia bonniea]WJF94090.1 flagellar export protein FliJ [Paraburkholderia bonniea]
MSLERTVNSLSRLVALRGREADRLSAVLVGKQAQCERQRHMLERMETLKNSTVNEVASVTAKHHPALALNRADYQDALQQLIETQREALARHETEVAASRDAWSGVALKHKSLDTVLQRKQMTLQQAGIASEQKRQDQMANQAWQRRAAR